MENKAEELVWIDGIFLTERPIVKGNPPLGRLIIETPDDATMKLKRGGKLILLATKDYAVGDEFYSRVVSVHPDEPNYKVGDYVVVAAPGVPVKFSGVFCESVMIHTVLHKLN